MGVDLLYLTGHCELSIYILLGPPGHQRVHPHRLHLAVLRAEGPQLGSLKQQKTLIKIRENIVNYSATIEHLFIINGIDIVSSSVADHITVRF